jgi:hypothetical protein
VHWKLKLTYLLLFVVLCPGCVSWKFSLKGEHFCAPYLTHHGARRKIKTKPISFKRAHEGTRRHWRTEDWVRSLASPDAECRMHAACRLQSGKWKWVPGAQSCVWAPSDVCACWNLLFACTPVHVHSLCETSLDSHSHALRLLWTGMTNCSDLWWSHACTRACFIIGSLRPRREMKIIQETARDTIFWKTWPNKKWNLAQRGEYAMQGRKRERERPGVKLEASRGAFSLLLSYASNWIPAENSKNSLYIPPLFDV